MSIKTREMQREFIDKVCLLNHDTNKILKYSFKTFGCQMNENDSEHISGILEEMGYIYEKNFKKADLIFYNTCCIRKSAEEKTYGWIGTLKELKEKNPDLIICLTGCMTEQEHVIEKIKKSYRHVDILLGTSDLHTLPEKIYNKRIGQKIKYVKPRSESKLIEIPYISRTDPYKAYVTIMRGCNNFCSYCIVPYVRGREISRKKEDIIAEIKTLANDGCLEITLLGQNVNSYGNDLGVTDEFTNLLYEIANIDGIERIRFMTSHPKDLSDSLITAIKEIDKVCNYLHLPLQSGSTKILGEMNRHYSKESFLDLITRIRKEVKDIVITSDIIVGFPGESDQDFEDTLDVVREASFDNSYMFIYSKRDGTAAAKRNDFVKSSIVKERFDRLLELQNSISYEMNKKMLNRTYKVLVESISKNNKDTLTGRTEGNKLVHFKGEENMIGRFVNIKIKEIKSFSLEGELVNE